MDSHLEVEENKQVHQRWTQQGKVVPEMRLRLRDGHATSAMLRFRPIGQGRILASVKREKTVGRFAALYTLPMRTADY